MGLEEFEGISTESIIVVVDPATGGSERGNMGWLRSLPYLRSQGVMAYTFSPSWLSYGSDVTFDEVMTEHDTVFNYTAIADFEFEYHLIKQSDTPEAVQAHHLCQYTSREIEEKGDSSTTYKLLNAFYQGQIDKLLLVVDAAEFRIAGMEAQKPLTETLDNVSELSYEGIAKQYLKRKLDARYLGYNETLNIWLHEAAAEYNTVMGSEPTRTADLFAFTRLEPGIRTWDFLEFLATKTTKDETDHVQATIRPWVERDITLIHSHILNALQEFEFDAEQIRAFRSGND